MENAHEDTRQGISPSAQAGWLDAGMRNCAEDDPIRLQLALGAQAETKEAFERRMAAQAPLMMNVHSAWLPKPDKEPPPSRWTRITRWLGI